MHEFSIAQSICDIALNEAKQHGARRVLQVKCRVGVFRQIVPDVLQTAFELCAENSEMQGAKLIVETEPVQVSCAACKATTEVPDFPTGCPACGSDDITFTGGQDLSLVSIEIEQEEESP